MQALGKFKAALTSSELQVLHQCLSDAMQALPENFMAWYLGSSNRATGHLDPEHAKILQSLRQDWKSLPQGLSWDTPEKTPASRSLALAQLAEDLRVRGFITGWRNEKFSFWFDERTADPLSKVPEPSRPDAFCMERAAFRFFGLHSHAVHINGFTPEGFMWCGRRAMSKATDPGLLDNLAAGGLPAGESLAMCSVRELWEEAGVPASLALTRMRSGQVSTCRKVQEGWHHETLWIDNLTLPPEVQPVNQDGEVGEFVCMSPTRVIQAIEAKSFTADAACVIAQSVLKFSSAHPK